MPPSSRQPPVAYSDELVETICDRIAGGESLHQICQAQGMPARTTIYRWLHKNADFARRYAAAMLMRAEFWADEIIAIADRLAEGENTLAAAKLRIQVRQWLLGRLGARRDGDRVTLGGKPAAVKAPDTRALMEELNQKALAILDQVAHAKATQLKIPPAPPPPDKTR